MKTKRPHRFDEEGITLIELIVYVALAGVVLLVVSSIFINGWLSQAATTKRDQATATANAVSASLQQSARNATELRVPDAQTLIATVATGGATTECRAWRFSGGELYYMTGAAPLGLAGDDEWIALADNVKSASFGPVAVDGGTKAEYVIQFGDPPEAVEVSGGLAAQAQVELAGGPKC